MKSCIEYIVEVGITYKPMILLWFIFESFATCNFLQLKSVARDKIHGLMIKTKFIPISIIKNYFFCVYKTFDFR